MFELDQYLVRKKTPQNSTIFAGKPNPEISKRERNQHTVDDIKL
jgi:hypothetical protein